MEEDGIDFVLPWVDGSDAVWRGEKEKYAPGKEEGEGTDSSDYRYRDWGILRYWFRGAEKFAPWVRKIHFITCGHQPSWLNLKHPKLNLVRHSDYIPAKYLPTFSSHPIELNLHRIEALSGRFVYFNDDVFLVRPVEETAFFLRNKPRMQASLSAHVCSDIDSIFTYILFNDRAVIFRNFPKKKRAILRHLWKWVSPANGFMCGIKNFVNIAQMKFGDFNIHHSPAPLLKQTLRAVWEKEGEMLDKTCSRKFRSAFDVNQYLFQEWQIMTGTFAPVNTLTNFRYFTTLPEDLPLITETITKQTLDMVCINDVESAEEDFEGVKNAIISAFAAILPEKSEFETDDGGFS